MKFIAIAILASLALTACVDQQDIEAARNAVETVSKARETVENIDKLATEAQQNPEAALKTGVGMVVEGNKAEVEQLKTEAGNLKTEAEKLKAVVESL
jgi:hypothetical protein